MDNRRQLLECALNLFSQKGYDAVGVQEIVEAAHVTKPTLYHYFTSKRGLLDALLKEHFIAFLADLREAASYQHDITLTLQKIAALYFNFAKDDPEFYRMQLSMQFASPGCEPSLAVDAFRRDQYQIIEELFFRAAEDHGNMKGRQMAYAFTFLGMINTYVGLFLINQAELNDRLVYQAVHQFMHGIFS
jgi:AcrR family transcriptional regulator